MNTQTNTFEKINETDSSVAIGLGLFSLALGASEVLLTEELAEAAGFKPEHHTLLKIFGVREIVSGIGLLAAQDKKPWLWSRLVGDALDVAFMTYAFATARNEAERKRLLIAATAVSPIIALDAVKTIGVKASPQITVDEQLH